MTTTIGKKLGKFKQWTGEKLGKANKTKCSDEFQRLEQETDQRKDTFERLFNASEGYLRTLEKKKKGPEDKNKVTPILSLAYSLVAQGQSLPPESPYGQAMVRFGEAQEQMATNQLNYANKLRENYVNGLEEALNQLKELQQSRKKLESRRLDYNAKLNAVQKAKKEKPELEEQMRAAELKFNESMDDAYSRMVAISNAEEMHMEQLAMFYDLELDYFQNNVRMLTRIKDAFDRSAYSSYYKSTRKSPNLSVRGDHSVSRSKSYRAQLPANHEDQPVSFPKPICTPIYTNLARSDSDASEDMMSNTHVGSTPSRILIKTPSFNRDIPVPVLPRRVDQKKLVQVLYDFDGVSQDELPIRKGDMVTVLDEIDEGWWIGEIVDNHGRRAGMFPSNYVEEIAPNIPPAPIHARKPHDTSKRVAVPPPSSVSRYNVASSDPLLNQNEAPLMQGETHRRLAPLPPTNSITQRNTPPNPSDTRRLSSPHLDRVLTLNSQSAGNSPFDDHAAEETILCQKCGCLDYKANVFKQNSCNNCSHTH